MILIALGANLPSHAGPPAQTLRASLIALSGNAVRPLRVSNFYVSPAWPDPADPAFVNAVAQVETTLNPAELMALLAQIENEFGRIRKLRNAPRTLDLDLLDYDGRIEAGPPTLPHPRIETRSFVLVPLGEVAPGWRHPVSGRSVEQMIAALGPQVLEKLPA